jgi:hypothetical protein
MTTRSKLLLAALTATMVMLLTISASARRLALSSQQLLATWSSLAWENVTGTVAVSCPMELEGTFHSSTLSKVSGQLVGYITRATIAGETTGAEPPCTGGTLTVLTATLPWHIRYQSFAGTLPNIERIVVQFVGVSVMISMNNGFLCLMATTAVNPIRSIITREAGGSATAIRADEASTIPVTGAFCNFGGNGRLKGTGEVFQQIPGLGLSTTRIRVTLVQ